jgi:predicted 3-demethylubiquinone-9 3-methyltransferase (glyoxalase superfamily)
MKSMRPFLMFEGNAEAAMNLYVAVFPGAAILEIAR